MKIAFLFQGALTANQEKAVELADKDSDVKVLSSLPKRLVCDRLIYGSGFDVADNVNNSTPFNEYWAELGISEPKVKKKKLGESKIAVTNAGKAVK